MQLPFSPFECGMMSALNVAPSQLHPNTWGFLKAFQILCEFLRIQPIVNKFIYFYQIKYGDPIGWISLCGAQYGPLFSLYCGS